MNSPSLWDAVIVRHLFGCTLERIGGMRENIAEIDMANNTAVSEIFYAAFKALGRPQREQTMTRLLQDREVRQDLFDLALIQRAKSVKGRPIEARRYFSKRYTGR